MSKKIAWKFFLWILYGMALQSDHGLLVVNLDSCLSNTAAEQVVKGDCVYTVAVASDISTNEDEAVVHIPLPVPCSEEVQQTIAAVTQLSAAQQPYAEKINANGHYEQIGFKKESHLTEQQTDHLIQQNEVLYDKQNVQNSTIAPDNLNDVQDIDDSYYSEICNYLTAQILPQGVTESYKKVLRKRAQNYMIIDGELYHGHKQPKRVLTEKAQQLELLRNVHIEEGTGVHLGLKKMHSAINRNYFWRGLYVDVANFVRQCNGCSEHIDIRNVDNGVSSKECNPVFTNSENESSLAVNALVADTKKVWQEVEARICGPYPRTECQNEFILGIIDPCSHWISAHPIPGSDLDIQVADIICRTFCTFGFANCKIVNMEYSDAEKVQSRYDEHVMSLQENLLNSGLSIPRNITCLKEEQSHCEWARRMFDEFVAADAITWDVRLDKFVFEFCTKMDNDSSSPFIRMFGRSPISFLEENKENNCSEMSQPKDQTILPKRRRLQSSILQCRHCEEIFTSKISFRIHQRKHTEEARRQGTLEGEEPLQRITEREKGMLRRAAVKRKQRFMRHGNVLVPVADCGEKYYNVHKKFDTTLQDYLIYWEKYMKKNCCGMPCLYLKDWHFTRDFPEEFIYRVPQYFSSDWLNEYFTARTDIKDDYRFVYMGPKGSWTPLHVDVFTSFSWSINVCGQKRWLLFPPGEERCLRDNFGHLACDVTSDELKDEKQYPQYRELHNCIEVIQGIGEAIFVPSGWHHQVWNLEDTISINHNWINGCNIGYMWNSLQRELVAVRREVEDCREMEGWEKQCQLMLKSIFGIDYQEFYTFLLFIAKRRLDSLEMGKQITLFGNWHLGKNHTLFDLKQLREILSSFSNETHIPELDIYKNLEYNPEELIKEIDMLLTHS